MNLLASSQGDNAERGEERVASYCYSLDRAYHDFLRSTGKLGAKERANVGAHFREQSEEVKAAFGRFILEQLDAVRRRTRFTLIIEGWQGGHFVEEFQRKFKKDRVIHIAMNRGEFSVEGRSFSLPGFDPKSRARDHSFSYYKETLPKLIALGAEVFQHLRARAVATLVAETKYQSFEDLGMPVKGSNSAAKFAALEFGRLGLDRPSGGGQRIVDIGCQSGYFSIRLASVARSFRVTGVEANRKAARVAAQYNAFVYELPNLDFWCGDAMEFKRGDCNVIVAASVFHYFRDGQQAFLDHVHSLLRPGGHLVLECGISTEQPDVAFVQKHARGVDKADPCHFPNRKRLDEMLRGFRVTYEGPSVKQAGDPIPRHVLHLQRI